MIFWAVNANFAVAAVLGGVLARQGFGCLFWIDSLSGLTACLIVRRWLPADKPREERPKANAPYRAVLCDWVMLAYVELLLVHASVQFEISSTLSLAMTEKGLFATDCGVATAVNGGWLCSCSRSSSGVWEDSTAAR